MSSNEKIHHIRNITAVHSDVMLAKENDTAVCYIIL